MLVQGQGACAVCDLDQCVDQVGELLVDGRLVGLIAAGRLILAAADVRQLWHVRGSVDVLVLFVGVLSDPSDDDFVVLSEQMCIRQSA